MNSSNVIRVVKAPPNLRELTTKALRNAILSMYFKPNQRLVERTLCEQTGVSRTCVREALQHLESEGLVERVAYKGLFVAAVNADEARQIYEVRASLESTAGRMFVKRASDNDFKALEVAFNRLEEALNKTDVMPYVYALDEFYDILLTGAGNDVARNVLRTMRARMNYLRALTSKASDLKHKQETNVRMRKIVDAVLRRDGTATAKHCRKFVERSADFAAQVLRENDEKSDG
jgi:DNA-binding GntR family transcriptional regulator